MWRASRLGGLPPGRPRGDRSTAGDHPRSHYCPRSLLAEDPEVAEKPPQDEKDEDGAEAPTAHLLRSISRGEAAQQFAHETLRRDVCRPPKCTSRTGGPPCPPRVIEVPAPSASGQWFRATAPAALRSRPLSD